MGDKGEPQVLSLKMKTFDEDVIKDEMVTREGDDAMDGRCSDGDSQEEGGAKQRFGGRFHRRSLRRGSKYKMTHRSPTEVMKVKKQRRAKANDRERTRMQTLNVALEKLRVILPAFPDETKLTKIETLRFANNYIYALTEMVSAQDSGTTPNIPTAGMLEGMWHSDGQQEPLQKCAFLAHSLMSHQFGSTPADNPNGSFHSGLSPDQQLSPEHSRLHPMTPMRGQVHHQPDFVNPHHQNYHHQEVTSPMRGHHNQLVTSPPRGQHHIPVSPGPEAMGHMPHPHNQLHHGQMSPLHHGQMSPHMMSPIKPIPQVPNSLSPHNLSPPAAFQSPVVSPHKKEDFIDNNPGFYNNNVNNHNQLWSPGHAITPAPPQFDDCYPQPAASSSLYGQDLRYPYY